MFEVNYTTEPSSPLVFVPVESPDGFAENIPEDLRNLITVDVIHDGRIIPEEYLVDRHGRRIEPEVFFPHYVRERDWGASIVATRLCQRLGLPGFHKVTTARCLLDFGRFPGTTRKNASHLRRFAINYPFSELLSHQQKKRLLEEHYDAISRQMDEVLRGRVFKIAIHTYDRLNASGTVRPQVSLVTRALGYQLESEMPFGVFDPLYPDILAEFTVNRMLRDRISLTLERAGIPVAHNYPYLLPEGSPEVRHQVLRFFEYLQQRYQQEHPETRMDPGHGRVWQMLQDTNLRSGSAGSLRSVLHMYRRPPKAQEAEFAAAEDAYARIAAFLQRDDNALVDDYRFRADRPNSFGIEVRKDLTWAFGPGGMPLHASYVRAWHIADALAHAIQVYLSEDRPLVSRPLGGFSQATPWYHGQAQK